jgi:hypothetical protein
MALRTTLVVMVNGSIRCGVSGKKLTKMARLDPREEALAELQPSLTRACPYGIGREGPIMIGHKHTHTIKGLHCMIHCDDNCDYLVYRYIVQYLRHQLLY